MRWLCVLACALARGLAADLPHIVMVIVDDLGYANVGFNWAANGGAEAPPPEVQTPTMECLTTWHQCICRHPISPQTQHVPNIHHTLSESTIALQMAADPQGLQQTQHIF